MHIIVHTQRLNLSSNLRLAFLEVHIVEMQTHDDMLVHVFVRLGVQNFDFDIQVIKSLKLRVFLLYLLANVIDLAANETTT